MAMISESKSKLDNLLGLEVYGTSTQGLGGVIRKQLEDFIVEEIPTHGGSSGNLLMLVVEKRGIDTLAAAIRLAKKLKIPLRHIGFAGLKDARSISIQRFTVKVPADIDISLISNKNMKVLATYRAKRHLRPGMLLGNKFTITVRDVTLPFHEVESIVKETLSQIEEIGGVPNFYGYQRFGLSRPNTHIVGKLIIQGCYDRAIIELLATPYPNEPQNHKEARAFLLETMDFSRSLKKFPKVLIFERLVIKHLIKHPNDYVGALKALPKHVLTLYVDAYLSYIFNKALSERLRKFKSLKVLLEGDIVAKSDVYGNPLRPTTIVKDATRELKEGELIMALIPAYLKSRVEGYMNDLILLLFKRDGLEPPFRKLGEIGLQGKLGLIRQIAFRPLNFKYQLCEGEKSIKLNFILPKSSYATIMLREIMKPEDPLALGF